MTWRRPSIEPGAIPIGFGSTIPRRFCVAARVEIGSRSPVWRAVHATRAELPGCLGELVEVLGAGSLNEIEVARWMEPVTDIQNWPPTASRDALVASVAGRPFAPACATWRIAAVLSVVVGPARFNDRLKVHGSKAAVHFEAFDRLLQQVWHRAADGRTTFVTGDKHGGRHYYMQPLSGAFPDAWIDRGLETPEPEPVHDS